MCAFKSSVSWWLWMGGSIVFALLAMIAALCWGTIIEAVIASLLVLSPDSQTYQRWIAPDQPLFFEVFMYNWTNADRFPEKPKLEQLGPYRFREVRKHVNVTFHHHNSSVAYRTQRTWYFDETSNGSLQDHIISINMLTASAIFQSRDSDMFKEYFVTSTLNQYDSKLSVSKTVGELLFAGYEDRFLNFANIFAAKDVPKMDRFGWLYPKNNSIDTDGYMEVSTGADGLLGQVLKWNHQDSIPNYEGKCSRLAGSAGEFMARNLTVNSSLTMFVPDLYRTVDLEYVDSGQMEGLEYHRFEMLESCFDLSSVSQENTCFCNGECKWSGVMDVSLARYNTPSFLSLPHFLHADPRLAEAVEGMAPDPEKHSFYFSVEPMFGVPLDVAARFQFNVYLTPWSGWGWTIPKPMLMPVFWVQQHVKVTDNIFSELRVARGIAQWGGVILAVIGLICISVTIVCSSRKPKYVIISTG